MAKLSDLPLEDLYARPKITAAVRSAIMLKEDFSKMTPSQLKMAPVLVVEMDTVDFGEILTNTQSNKTVKITNKGKTQLSIRQIILSRSTFTAKAETMTLEPLIKVNSFGLF